jgi:hypothetical protein
MNGWSFPVERQAGGLHLRVREGDHLVGGPSPQAESASQSRSSRESRRFASAPSGTVSPSVEAKRRKSSRDPAGRVREPITDRALVPDLRMLGQVAGDPLGDDE